MLSEYVLGLLYGDGNFQMKEGIETYFFSSTHREIRDRIAREFKENKFRHTINTREHVADYKINYQSLDILDTRDKKLLSYLVECGFKSDNPEDRIHINPDFIRGYLETKGTLFEGFFRNSTFWRVAFSGNEEDLLYLKSKLSEVLGTPIREVTQRKEREDQGIISKSYRLSIQSRDGVAKLINYIDSEDVSAYLKLRIEGFKAFHASTPFNMKRKAFKHYKNAVRFMSRELGIEIKGIRGSVAGIKKGYKPTFLWENGEKVREFRCWEEAYEWTSNKYLDETGHTPPIVNPLTETKKEE